MDSIQVSERVENAKRKMKLEWYSAEIPKRMDYLGSILRELEADPLQPWLLTHNTTHEYLSDLCGMTLRRIQQLTAGEEAKQEMKALMPEAAQRIDGMKERAVREIIHTPPAQRMEVLTAAVRTPGRVTASKIKQARARLVEPEAPAPAIPCCPTCNRPL